MAEKIYPLKTLTTARDLKTLTTARDKLVEERHALAGAIALGYRRRRTDESHTDDCEALVGIQNTIEAIDRAIAHENMMTGEHPGSFVAPTLVPFGADLRDPFR